ncbi:MAG TPA: cytochrome P450 [Herpetosiphonaceae bacterium]
MQAGSPSLSLNNLYRPEILANPYSFYQRLRSEAPIHWDGYLHGWVLTRYADVVACLPDRRISADRTVSLMDRMPPEQRAALRRLFEVNARQLAFLDPPDHTVIRRILNPVFTLEAVAALRERIQSIVDQLLARSQSGGRLDLVRDLADPLPALVIAELVGIPFQDLQQLRAWYDESFNLLGASITQAQLDRALKTFDTMLGYFRTMLARLQQRPQPSLLGMLVSGQDVRAFSEDELFAQCQLFLDAGHGPPASILASSIWLLLQHPDQLRRLRDDPALVGSALEECLRYESPVQLVIRRAQEDVPVDGVQIRQGDLVYLMLGAANHDPARFAEPERFDIGRDPNPHLAFGYARHRCIGQWLARLEGEIVLTTLLQRLPTMRLGTDAAVWQKTLALRGLAALPVVI